MPVYTWNLTIWCFWGLVVLVILVCLASLSCYGRKFAEICWFLGFLSLKWVFGFWFLDVLVILVCLIVEFVDLGLVVWCLLGFAGFDWCYDFWLL